MSRITQFYRNVGQQKSNGFSLNFRESLKNSGGNFSGGNLSWGKFSGDNLSGGILIQSV